jgi:hypothetical protein
MSAVMTSHTASPVRKLFSLCRKRYLRYQVWRTEVELNAIEQERRQLAWEAREAVMQHADLVAALRNEGEVVASVATPLRQDFN